MTRFPPYILLAVLLILPTFASFSDVTANDSGRIDSFVMGQRIPDYETARMVFWKALYNGGGETLYCGKKLKSSYNKGVNIEHVFPASWVAYSLHCGKRKQCRLNNPQFNLIEADLHNLYPSRSDINKARSNYRFAIIRGEQRVFGKCDFEFDEYQRIAEPAPEARGRIARAMLYMAEEYDLYLKKKLKRLLLDWDKKYPPEQAEYKRNDRIEQLQGNRNPYIDLHKVMKQQ
ncbi:extracellular deoxyribonuclease precursor [bacterium BMS3Bbin11]|nr:extracellular deoxyribonuclease precursor [bacterium BMS3Bbin11]